MNFWYSEIVTLSFWRLKSSSSLAYCKYIIRYSIISIPYFSLDGAALWILIATILHAPVHSELSVIPFTRRFFSILVLHRNNCYIDLSHPLPSSLPFSVFPFEEPATAPLWMLLRQVTYIVLHCVHNFLHLSSCFIVWSIRVERTSMSLFLFFGLVCKKRLRCYTLIGALLTAAAEGNLERLKRIVSESIFACFFCPLSIWDMIYFDFKIVLYKQRWLHVLMTLKHSDDCVRQWKMKADGLRFIFLLQRGKLAFASIWSRIEARCEFEGCCRFTYFCFFNFS